MSEKVKTVLSWLLCAVLIGCALCVGFTRDWQKQRAEVLNALTQDSALVEQLQNRAMDAANLAVVVARHLDQEDAALGVLKEASSLLLSGETKPEVLLAADESLTRAAASLRETLLPLPSVRASARDQAYISMLTRTLSEGADIASAYRTLAEDFNHRLNGSATGAIARLLGVHPLSIPQLAVPQ